MPGITAKDCPIFSDLLLSPFKSLLPEKELDNSKGISDGLFDSVIRA